MGRGNVNLTESVGGRPPPSLLRIFAKLGGWFVFSKIKMDTFIIKNRKTFED
jgi:hypothetical protein